MNRSKSSNIKSLNFLENIKENCAIKAFNHVNKTSRNPLVDEPEIANFVIDSIRLCDKGILDISPSKDNFADRIKKIEAEKSQKKSVKKYNIERDRKDMIKLK